MYYLESYNRARTMASITQYECELLSIEEFRSSRIERGKKDISSPSPSPLKLKKI